MSTPIPTQQSAFEADFEAYVKALPAALTGNEGKFALIGGGKFIGVYPDEDAAMTEGYRQFGLKGFLVQEISRFDVEMAQHWVHS